MTNIKPQMIFLFLILAASSVWAEQDTTQTDQMWTQMTNEQKREVMLNYYQQQLQSQANQSTQANPQCPDPSSNAVRQELNQLHT